MKTSKLISLFTLFSFILLLVSCNKYEEGSNFSLVSAKKRISGNWKLTSMTVNGNSVSYYPYKISIKEDYTYFDSEEFLGYTVEDYGTWKFNGNKTSIIFTDSDGDVRVHEIQELRKEELKLKEMDGSDEIMRTFQPQ